MKSLPPSRPAPPSSTRLIQPFALNLDRYPAEVLEAVLQILRKRQATAKPSD